MAEERIIIVGGGFGGIAAAKSLQDSDFDILLIDRENHHLFQPLLYQVATAALSPGDIATPIRGIFKENSNVRVLMADVDAVDKENDQLILKDGRKLDFDQLVLAPGARYNYFGNPQWEHHAPGLKSIGDALDVRERILISLEEAEQITDPEERAPYLTYVVIGGGPTGVEMAGAIAEIAKRNMMRDFRRIDPAETRVILIEAMDQILNAYPRDLAEKARKDLENMGVEVRLNSMVTNVRPDGVMVNDQFLATPNIVWAAGVSASPMLESLGVESDKAGRIKVEPDNSIPGKPNIFVIGDACYLEDDAGNPLPALAPVALQQGRHVAKLLKHGYPKPQRPPFKYVDKGSMATIGRAKAVADIKGLKVTGLLAWLLWSLVHIFFLIGFRNRFRVMAEWFWHYITFKRGVRLITGRISSDEAERKRDVIE